MNQSVVKSFNKLCLSTLVAVYILILVGSIVRSTGSGMGCPDWPKCFGSWIPPASVDNLPSNYKEIYAAARVKKNVKFTNLLRSLGMNDTANKLLNDKNIFQEEEFSPIKSKIEYINRIVGVVIGLMISFLLLRSFKFLKLKPSIFITTLVAWLSVVFTGWFGSIVVSTNLTPWTVSVHLGFAMLILGLLIFAYQRTTEPKRLDLAKSKWLIWFCLFLLLIQMILGIQVREALDQVIFKDTYRGNWISSLGMEFFVHRSFSWLVFLFNTLLAYKLVKNFGYNWQTSGLVALTLASVISGVGMAYGSVPAFLQPLHLIFSALNFGILMLMFFQSREVKGDMNYA